MADDRWTVRGVPPDLQASVAAEAKRRRWTLGEALTDALKQWLAGGISTPSLFEEPQPTGPQAGASLDLSSIMSRIEAIEAAVREHGDMLADMSAIKERVAAVENRAATQVGGNVGQAADKRQTKRIASARRPDNQLDIEDFARPITDATEPPATEPAEPSDTEEAPPPNLPPFNAALAAAMEAEGLKAPAVSRRMAEMGRGVTAEAIRLWLKGGGITHERRAALAEIFPTLKEIEQ